MLNRPHLAKDPAGTKKVTLDITASLGDSSGHSTISQSLQYIRYMYVNVGGD
ncbi:MAG TPA: hypothetical protein VFE53_00555 [Mucilaginibacter sp.]|nr:hypothetical protein [Mucilaginibacter sp.]